ncbi:MAG: AAA family ATPase [Rickettsiales bacterium]|jgi:DNA replication and repair protein RecF|nr:AAA family ATPase [Rickettsiales bacterium]
MIEQLTLTNFRNHESFRIRADGGNVALSGANGAGKTNVLEALSLLSGGFGLRGAQSGDLARFGTNEYAVAAKFSDGSELCVFWLGGGRRKAKVDGESVPLSELPKRVGIVWLTSAEDLLFCGPPSGRRAFFDNLVAGFDGRHTGRVARLSKLLSERAFALRNGADENWLGGIEANIASAASAVADARVRYVAELNHFFSDGVAGLSGMLEQKIMDGEKAGDFEDFYLKYLSENRFLIADKMSVDGAHRTDFSVMNRKLGLPAEKTSSGQQKLLLNKLIIANAKLLRAKNPSRPLLVLLDEADSHLDGNARDALFAGLADAGAQIWLSGTNAAAFAPVPNCKTIAM